MAQKYYNTQETAQIFGITPEEVKLMLDRRELHGYRDGADWKFKVEDIDRIAKERQAEKQAASEEEQSGDVLLSEVELGQSDIGTSGTVIGLEKGGLSVSESDIRFADSDIQIASDSSSPQINEVDSKVAQFEELDLTLDEDLTLEDSSVKLNMKPASDGSVIGLSDGNLEDDDLVLGGSGVGSDITIGGDSGISLVDPSDSGLSLEQPLNLAGAAEESLELGEDDLIAVADSTLGAVKGDDDFLLTPMEDAADADDSESGSQVIALDAGGDEAATMIGSGASGASMASMLDEDLTQQPVMDLGMGAPMISGPTLTPQPVALGEGMAAPQPSTVLPEAPYTGWQVTGLVAASLLLMLCGMMMFDLMRNMWSWDSPYAVNSSLMDMILGLFEG